MPVERLAAVRRIAEVVAAQDMHAALTEYEQIAIQLAREVLGLIDEITRLRTPRADAATPQAS